MKRLSQVRFQVITLVMNILLAVLLMTLGYLVAPLLFSTLETKIAGDLAGHLFVFSGWTLVTVLSLWLGWSRFKQYRSPYVLVYYLTLFVMLLLLLIVSPWVAEIKQNYPAGITRESIEWPLFASLHGIYQLGYLIVIIVLFFNTWQSWSEIRRSLSK